MSASLCGKKQYYLSTIENATLFNTLFLQQPLSPVFSLFGHDFCSQAPIEKNYIIMKLFRFFIFKKNVKTS